MTAMWRGVLLTAVLLSGVFIGIGNAQRLGTAVIPAGVSPADTLVDAVEPLPPSLPQPSLNLILPTSNTALLDDDGPSFYQYTDRYFEGRRSTPWEGGQYGYVRNPRRTDHGLVYTRFHEGVDIQVLYRDARGEPLDTVVTVDDGKVVFVNNSAGASTYGKYVVVEHWWSGSPFYSLYAHLNSTDVRVGQEVERGDALGRVGYTGRGIDKRRAHLHFEINVKLSSSFDVWHGRLYRSGSNSHGNFNGINLAGLDVAALYQALQDNPYLTIEDFLQSQEAFFAVAVPDEGYPDLLTRYPWLMSGNMPSQDAASWEIFFTASGFPLEVRRSSRQVEAPVVTMVRNVEGAYGLYTSGRLAGTIEQPALSTRGLQYMSLVTMPAAEEIAEETEG